MRRKPPRPRRHSINRREARLARQSSHPSAGLRTHLLTTRPPREPHGATPHRRRATHGSRSDAKNYGDRLGRARSAVAHEERIGNGDRDCRCAARGRPRRCGGLHAPRQRRACTARRGRRRSGPARDAELRRARAPSWLGSRSASVAREESIAARLAELERRERGLDERASVASSSLAPRREAERQRPRRASSSALAGLTAAQAKQLLLQGGRGPDPPRPRAADPRRSRRRPSVTPSGACAASSPSACSASRPATRPRPRSPSCSSPPTT